MLEFRCCLLAQLTVAQEFYQSLDVVTAVHVTQKIDRCHFVNQGAFNITECYIRQEGGFDVSGFINTWWNTVGNEIDKIVFFTGGWRF